MSQISLTFPDGAKREFPSGITGVELTQRALSSHSRRASSAPA